MPQLRPIPIENGRNPRPVVSEAHARLLSELAKAKGRAEPGQIGAFNQNRECYVGMQIVAGDFPLSGLKDWLSTLTPNSGSGVWMVPFRGIVANDVTAPLDLLYLDEDCKVLDAVEFFPTFRVSPSSPPAASVLALPSHSIFASQTQRGDRLILCSLDEMEWHLDQAVHPAASYPGVAPEFARPSATSPPPISMPRPAVLRDEPRKPAGPMLVRDDPSPGPTASPAASLAAEPMRKEMAAAILAPQPIAVPSVAPAPPAPPPPQDPTAGASAIPAQPKRGWLSRFLNPEPGDPRRKSNRLPVKGLAAHFFTGGAPHPHDVRDISPTGLYVVTAERWYPGTVIRMTLTKQEGGEHPSERSITIHAQSMRWGNDGVGLEFLFESRKSGRPPGTSVDKEQLAAFLKKLS
jgi:hypothetical protein